MLLSKTTQQTSLTFFTLKPSELFETTQYVPLLYFAGRNWQSLTSQVIIYDAFVLGNKSSIFPILGC